MCTMTNYYINWYQYIMINYWYIMQLYHVFMDPLWPMIYWESKMVLPPVSRAVVSSVRSSLMILYTCLNMKLLHLFQCAYRQEDTYSQLLREWSNMWNLCFNVPVVTLRLDIRKNETDYQMKVNADGYESIAKCNEGKDRCYFLFFLFYLMLIFKAIFKQDK